MDTILHEIAHALAFERYNYVGHGPLWQRVCVEIGARPYPKKALANETVLATYKYTLNCKCGVLHARHRVQRGAVYRCGRCSSHVVFA